MKHSFCKILLLALMLAAAFCLLCFAASAAEVEVATDEDLRSAVSSAADGDVIIVTADVALADNMFVESKAITIRGPKTGDAVTVSRAGLLLNIKSGGDVTLGENLILLGTGDTQTIQSSSGSSAPKLTIDGATVQHTTINANTIAIYGTNPVVTVISGTVSNGSTNNGNAAINFQTSTGASFVMTGGTITATTGIGVYFNSNSTGTSCEVTGGSINAKSNAIRFNKTTTAAFGGSASITSTGGHTLLFAAPATATFGGSVSISSTSYAALNSDWSGDGSTTSTFTFTGGTYTSASTSTAQAVLRFCSTGTAGNIYRVNISGGTFTATGAAPVVRMANNGSLTADSVISGGTFTANTASALELVTGNVASTQGLTILGGTFTGAYAVNLGSAAAGTLNVYGGTFLGTTANIYVSKSNSTLILGAPEAYEAPEGHTLSDLAMYSAYTLADGVSVSLTNNTGKTLLTKDDLAYYFPAAKIGETVYITLAAAVSAAAAGDTITILEDEAVTATITIDKSLTITATATHTIRYTGDGITTAHLFEVTTGGALTLSGYVGITTTTGRVAAFTGTAPALTVAIDDTAVITALTASNDYAGAMFYNDSATDAALTVNSGTISRRVVGTFLATKSGAGKMIFTQTGGTVSVGTGASSAANRTISTYTPFEWTMTGGTIESLGQRVYQAWSGSTSTLRISGGTIHNTVTGIILQFATAADVEIIGGDIVAGAESGGNGALYLGNADIEVTLGGTATLTTSAHSAFQFAAAASVTVSGGTINANGVPVFYLGAAGADAAVSGGTLNVSGAGSVFFCNVASLTTEISGGNVNLSGTASLLNTNSKTGTTITVNGTANITSASTAHIFLLAGSTTVNVGGTARIIATTSSIPALILNNASSAIYVTGDPYLESNGHNTVHVNVSATLEIGGGTFVAKTVNYALRAMGGTPTITITGGTFEGPTYAIQLNNEINAMSVSGATFVADISAMQITANCTEGTLTFGAGNDFSDANEYICQRTKAIAIAPAFSGCDKFTPDNLSYFTSFNDVAKYYGAVIGTEEGAVSTYADFAAAWAAKTAGCIITVGQNYTATAAMSTLTSAVTVRGTGDITLTGSSVKSTAFFNLNTGADLTVGEGITVISPVYRTVQFLSAGSGASFTLDGGTIQSTTNSPIVVFGTNPSVTINSGTVIAGASVGDTAGGYYGIFVTNSTNASVTINDGTLYGKENALYLNTGASGVSVKIAGGSVSCKAGGCVIYSVVAGTNSATGADITVSGDAAVGPYVETNGSGYAVELKGAYGHLTVEDTATLRAGFRTVTVEAANCTVDINGGSVTCYGTGNNDAFVIYDALTGVTTFNMSAGSINATRYAVYQMSSTTYDFSGGVITTTGIALNQYKVVNKDTQAVSQVPDETILRITGLELHTTRLITTISTHNTFEISGLVCSIANTSAFICADDAATIHDISVTLGEGNDITLNNQLVYVNPGAGEDAGATINITGGTYSLADNSANNWFALVDCYGPTHVTMSGGSIVIPLTGTYLQHSGISLHAPNCAVDITGGSIQASYLGVFAGTEAAGSTIDIANTTIQAGSAPFYLSSTVALTVQSGTFSGLNLVGNANSTAIAPVINWQGGTITTTSTAFSVSSPATLNITGGTFTVGGYGLIGATQDNAAGAQVAVSGVNVTAATRLVNVASDIDLKFISGTFTGYLDLTAAPTGDNAFTIYGGQYTANGDAVVVNATKGATLTIYGGKFLGSATLVTATDTNSVGGTILVKGGQYASSAESGYVFSKDTNSTITFVNGFRVSGGAGYISDESYGEVGVYEKDTMKMKAGAQVRYVADLTGTTDMTGIRFISIISKDAIDYITEVADADSIRYYTIILPTEHLATVAATPDAIITNLRVSKQYVKIAASNGLMPDGSGGYQIRAALINIKTKNYDRNFSAIGFAEFTIDGVTTYLTAAYNETENSRSIQYVALSALNDSWLVDDEGGYVFSDYQLTVLVKFAAGGEIPTEVTEYLTEQGLIAVRFAAPVDSKKYLI